MKSNDRTICVFIKVGHAVTIIEIDKLALKLSGISEHEGNVLAWKIREALATASPAAGHPPQIDSLKIAVERMPGEGMDFLSKRIVANLLSQIERSG